MSFSAENQNIVVRYAMNHCLELAESVTIKDIGKMRQKSGTFH